MNQVSVDLPGWWLQPLWKIWVNGKDDIPYIMEKKIHVWNHQPVTIDFEDLPHILPWFGDPAAATTGIS